MANNKSIVSMSDTDGVSDRKEIGYKGNIACHAANITYRQLDYWARTGLVSPTIKAASGSGTYRLYSFKDILVLKVIKKLLDAGVSLQQVRVAIAFLKEKTNDDLSSITLLSDGASVYKCNTKEEIIDILEGGQGVFGIAIGKVWKEVESKLIEFPHRNRIIPLEKLEMRRKKNAS